MSIDPTRSGIKDIWNAFMCQGTSFSTNDIPLCHSTGSIPSDIITWDEAKQIHKKSISIDKEYRFPAYVCFYIDDQKFDGPKGIWNNPKNALNILRHFEGVITPDYSTYQDFPDPLKRYNTYRMRAYGNWLNKCGLSVINNIRWGTKETWTYCFDGIPMNSIVAIGTVGGSPRKKIDRNRFEAGLFEMVDRLHPRVIIVYGSANYPCFKSLAEQGIIIVPFQSKTAKSFERRNDYE